MAKTPMIFLKVKSNPFADAISKAIRVRREMNMATVAMVKTGPKRCANIFFMPKNKTKPADWRVCNKNLFENKA